jgi:hypothetical protein
MLGWGQHDHKGVGSQGTGLTGVLTGLTGLTRKFDRARSVKPNSQAVRKKPSFAELLHKYQRIAEQKQNNRLGEQRWNSSLPKAKKHRRHHIGLHHLFHRCMCHGLDIQV